MFLIRSRYFVFILFLFILFISASVFVVQRFPSNQSFFAIGILVTSTVLLYRLLRYEWNKHQLEKKEALLKPELRKRYEEFCRTSGDLFEESHVDLSNEEIKVIRQHYRLAKILASIFIALLVALNIISWLLSDSAKASLIITGVSIVSIGVLLYFYHLSKKILQKKTKVLIKGVITDKLWAQVPGRGSVRIYAFEISLRKDIFQVSYKEFNRFRIGDIVTIERLSLESRYRQKIKRIGVF